MATKDAAEIQLIPAAELAPGQIGAIRNQLKNAVLGIACNELQMTSDRMVVRDINPLVTIGDLDFTYWDWNEVTGASATWETMSTGTMADQRWLVIYGVMDDDDFRSCSALKFNIGGADRVIWSLQQLPGPSTNAGVTGVSPGGVVIPPNAPYTISRYVRSINTPTHLILKGFVCEPRGKVLSP